MRYDELWQVFADNGTPIANKGATPDAFKNDQPLNMGNSHIWFWKGDGKTTEIMLQKRSLKKPSRPGWYHISAGGHINVGETPVIAAVRETQEEMGLDIDPEKLFFVQAVRIMGREPRDIVHVYLYRLKGDEKFTYADGEVDSYEWRTIDNFKEITKDSENNNLVPQGELYFKTLIMALEYVAESISLQPQGLSPKEIKALRQKLTADFTKRGLFTNVYSDKPGEISEPHAHAGATLVTLKGSARIRLDGGAWQTVVPGDITVIKDDQLHEVRAGDTGWSYLFACSQEEARRQGLI